MKRSIIYIVGIVFVSFLAFTSCKKEKEQREEIKTEKYVNHKKQNINISVLLDLSDRIDPKKYPNQSMEFFQRDLGYIELISKRFENHIRSKKSRSINDNIQLFLDPEPADKELNQKISDLKIAFNRNNATKDLILETSKKYVNACGAIYKQAISDGKYVGSDTWGFFKHKIKNYCVDENYRNVIVILTDGYIFHKDNKKREKNRTTYLTPETIKGFGLKTASWKKRFENNDFGFLPIEENLEDLEVLVIGINPEKGNPYEEDVINAYWGKWLKEMKVKKFQLVRADLPSHVDKIIGEFLLKKN
ncbi:hypothetical protein [Tenacibaculum aiptasiae]|uniref:hypothetical protein n=1 Tax=Tenacibaculum aiptasiae TaxID=426481 RepID=UPI00232B7507|nr:hypothetical protein [Tenacibaculum aiptasiae]